MENIEQGNVCSDVARRKRLFLRALEEDSEPFIKSAKNENDFEWQHLPMFFNTHKNELSKLYNLQIFCEYALKLFITFNCYDSELLFTILHMYEKVRGEYLTMNLCHECTEPLHYNEEDSIRVTIKEEAKNTYRFTNRVFYEDFSLRVYEEAIFAIYLGDYVFLQFLVKYGLSCTPNEDLVLFYFKGFFKALCNPSFIFSRRLVIENFQESDHLISTKLELLTTSEENPNFQRLTLITIAVAVSCWEFNNHRKFEKCMNLYSMTLPEAAISLKDVNDFLDVVFMDHKNFVSEILTSFKQVFPESPMLPSPKTLKQLCRCKVRDCLQKCSLLPNAVSKLQIPSCLKDFVLCMSC